RDDHPQDVEPVALGEVAERFVVGHQHPPVVGDHRQCVVDLGVKRPQLGYVVLGAPPRGGTVQRRDPVAELGGQRLGGGGHGGGVGEEVRVHAALEAQGGKGVDEIGRTHV